MKITLRRADGVTLTFGVTRIEIKGHDARLTLDDGGTMQLLYWHANCNWSMDPAGGLKDDYVLFKEWSIE